MPTAPAFRAISKKERLLAVFLLVASLVYASRLGAIVFREEAFEKDQLFTASSFARSQLVLLHGQCPQSGLSHPYPSTTRIGQRGEAIARRESAPTGHSQKSYCAARLSFTEAGEGDRDFSPPAWAATSNAQSPHSASNKFYFLGGGAGVKCSHAGCAAEDWV